jgi:arabinogalactan oligomer/maltooligosaccharide transport system substrate-binding protein
MNRKYVLTALLLLCALAFSPMVHSSPSQAREIISKPTITTIKLWHDIEDSLVLEYIAAGFMVTYPGIGINLEYKSDLENDFIDAALSGGGPDLVLGPNDWIGPFAELGLIQTVDTEFIPQDFIEQAVAGAVWNGHYWGVPNTYGNHLMLYYNKALLATAPLDTDEMITVGKSLTGGGQYGLVYHLDEPFWLIPWLTGFGGWVLDDTIDPPFPTLNTPEMVKALQFIHDLRWVHGIVPDGEVDYNAADTLFKDGKAAMMINGDWTLDAYRDHFGEANLGVARIPLVVDTAQWPKPMVGGKYYFISANSSGDKLAASKTFIQYATSIEPQLLWPDSTGVLPALKEAFKDPAVQGDPILQASADQASIGRLMPTSEAIACVWGAMREPLQDLWANVIEPQVAAATMQATAEQCYTEITRTWLYLPVVRKP